MFPTITLFSCVVSPRSLRLQGVDGELDPEDDPNNQGEDEFEEAEEDQHHHKVPEEEEEVVEEEEEPAAPAQHRDTHPQQPAVEEELVVSDGPEDGQTLRSCVQHQSSSFFTYVCVCVCVFRWLETQINRKTCWMTSTRRKWRMRCGTLML